MACSLCGISTSTFHNYMERGRELSESDKKLTKDELLYVDFLESVEGGAVQANELAIDAWLSAMENQVDPSTGQIVRWADWRAAESWLKRRMPEDFGDVSRSEVTQKTTLDAEKTTGVMLVPSSDMGNFAQALLESQNNTHLKAKELVDSADE